MLTAFLVIGGVGLVLLVASLVFGDLHEGLFGALDNDLFSTAVVAAFLSALGFVGAIVLATSGSQGLAVGGGLVAGAAMGYAARGLTRTLQRGEDSATIRAGDLTGRPGSVVEEIPHAGLGVVNIRVAGHLTRLHARCDEPLRTGTAVVVTGVLSPTAVTVRRQVQTPQDHVPLA